jgi:hypothetical protein
MTFPDWHHETPVLVSGLYPLLDIEPEISGRWRIICHDIAIGVKRLCPKDTDLSTVDLLPEMHDNKSIRFGIITE